MQRVDNFENESNNFWKNAWDLTKKVGRLGLDAVGMAAAVGIGAVATVAGYAVDFVGPALGFVGLVVGAVVAGAGMLAGGDGEIGVKIMSGSLELMGSMMLWAPGIGPMTNLGARAYDKTKEVVTAIKNDAKATLGIPETKSFVQSIKDFFQRPAQDVTAKARV